MQLDLRIFWYFAWKNDNFLIPHKTNHPFRDLLIFEGRWRREGGEGGHKKNVYSQMKREGFMKNKVVCFRKDNTEDAIVAALQANPLQSLCHSLMLFGSYTHSHTLFFICSHWTNIFLTGRSYKATGGRTQLRSRRWPWTAGFQVSPVTRQLMDLHVSIKPD